MSSNNNLCFKLVHELLQIELIACYVAPGFCEMLQRWHIYFRLTELYWHALNDKQKALENSRAAYAKAVQAKHHDQTWLASVRLADIYYKAN